MLKTENTEVIKYDKIRRVCLFLFVLSFGGSGLAGRIIYPWNATTAIVKAGDHLTVWFDADPDQKVTSVVFRGPHHAATASSVSEQTGLWVYDTVSEGTYDTRVTAAVPADTPEDRYDLILKTTTGQVISKRAVKIVPRFRSDYTIMHISDTHMCQGAKINDHPERLFKLSKYAEFANLIGAEMVFVTGDLINNNMFPPKRRAAFFYEGHPPADLKGMHGFNAATFSVAGNHDFLEGQQPATGSYQEKAKTWNDCHGLHHHHFVYGDTRCMIVNDGWHGFDWASQLTDHADWLDEVGQGTLRIAAYHQSEMGIMGAWAGAVDLGLAIIGHNHHLAHGNPYELDGRPILYYADSVREHFCVNLFRIQSDGRYTVVNNKEIVENLEAAPSDWTEKLTLTFKTGNDGTSMTNTATMPKGHRYAVSKGIVEQSFDGDSVHIVDVCVAVDANSETSIEIEKNGGLANR